MEIFEGDLAGGHLGGETFPTPLPDEHGGGEEGSDGEGEPAAVVELGEISDKKRGIDDEENQGDGDDDPEGSLPFLASEDGD